MATVSADSSTTISVPEGLIVTITTENNTTGTIARTYTNEGGTSQSVTDTVGPPAMNSVYGPYDRSCTMTIACTYGTITYVTSGNSVVTASIDPITGEIEILGPNGAILYVKDGSIVQGSAVKTVDPVDFYPVASYDCYGAALYGVSSTTGGQVVVINRDTGVQSNYGTSVPISGGGVSWIKALSNERLLVGANNGTLANTYYLTTDSGASWQTVLTMTINSVALALNPVGLCVATINGATVLVTGEYNTNGSRVSGSTNDQVRLLRSDDLGATWSEITRWNTDGTNNNIRHIHAVKQFAPNGPLYVLCGDTDAQSCIYRWDGATAWPINVSPANTVQSSGLKCAFGKGQGLRVVDCVWKDGYLWFGADSETGTGAGAYIGNGIWKIKDDLDTSTLQRVAIPNSLLRNTAIWFSVILSGGELCMITGNSNAIDGQKYNQIILSNKEWTEFKGVGAYRCADATTYPVPYLLREYSGNIYASCYGGAGKTETSTAVFRVSANDFRGDYDTYYRPDTIHPVYWVDQAAGSNSNNGMRPTAAWQTIDNAITGARMTYGARLQIIGDYTHAGGSVQPAMNGHSRPGDENEPLVIAGDGATSTTLTYGNAVASFVLYKMEGATAQKLEWQDLTFLCAKDTGTPITSNRASGAGAHTFGAIRCILGDSLNTTTRWSRLVTADDIRFYTYGSIVEASLSLANGTMESAAAGGGNFYFERSVLSGGNRQLRIRGTGNSIEFKDTISIGANQSVVNIEAAATVLTKQAIDSQFYSDQVSGAVVIDDDAGLTWAGEFKRCDVSGMSYGTSAAFDGYSAIRRWPMPAIDYADYVY